MASGADQLEKIVFRRMLLSALNSTVVIGRVLSKIGVRGGEHKFIRLFVDVGCTLQRLQCRPLPATITLTKATIAGVNVSIYKHNNGDDDEIIITKNRRRILNKLLLKNSNKKMPRGLIEAATSSSITRRPSPVLIYLHGGGWIFGSSKAFHSFFTELCRDIGTTLISVDYRLAPEHPYPAGLDDCLAVTRAILQADEKAHQLPAELRGAIDVTRVALAGDSSGGNFTGCIALEMIRSNEQRRIHAACMICPSLQVVTKLFPSYQIPRRFGYDPDELNLNLNWMLPRYAGFEPTEEQMKVISRERHIPPQMRRHLIAKYLTSPTDLKIAPTTTDDDDDERSIDDDVDVDNDKVVELPRQVTDLVTSKRAWPLLAEDDELAQMPITFVQACSHDLLLDEDRLFVERMRHAGAKDVRLSYVAKGTHVEAFDGKILRTKAGTFAYNEIVAFLRSVLFI